MAVSEKQMNYRFNMKTVLLKTLLTIYPNNDKQNIVKKVCSDLADCFLDLSSKEKVFVRKEAKPCFNNF